MTHTISGVQIFPANNLYNARIDTLPTLPQSASMIAAILAEQLGSQFNMSTSGGGNHGIPYNLVNNSTPTYMPTFTFASTSYAGPYPIPASPLQETDATDHHLICINTDTNTLYEITGAVYNSGANTWSANSGYKWDLTSNAMPPQGTTAASAASLPVLPGLILYDEILTGAITHALYLIIPECSGLYWWPAVHADGSRAGVPPDGSRLRLKASFDISSFSATNQVILTCLKQYGCLLMDTGAATSVKFQGMPDSRWNNTDIALLNAAIDASSFEVVNQSLLQVSPTSMQAASVPRSVARDPYFSKIMQYGPPQLYTRLSEASGLVVFDASGNGYNGTVNGGITLNQAGLLTSEPDAAVLGDGTSGYIVFPNALDPTGWTGLTLLLWWKLIDDTNFTEPIGNTHSGGHSGFTIYVNTPDQTIHFQAGNGLTFIDVGSHGTTAFGARQFLAITGDATAIKIYLNGALDTTGAAMPMILKSTVPITLSMAAEATNFGWIHGVFDEATIYNKALTADQIKTLYQTGLAQQNPQGNHRGFARIV